MSAFVKQHAHSGQYVKRLESVRERFTAFLRPLGIEFKHATTREVLQYALQRFRTGLAPATVKAEMSTIDTLRTLDGLDKIPLSASTRLFKAAMTKAKPRGSKFAGKVTFAPYQLVPHLTPPGSFTALRERALFTGRVETMARSGSFVVLKRSSMRQAFDQRKRPVVVFESSSKNAAAVGMSFDTFHVSHVAKLEGEGCDEDLCPACLMWQLKCHVDGLLPAATHDSLWTDEAGHALHKDSVAKIITKLMRRAGLDPVFTSHSLRHASSQTLQVLGVPAEDINLRGGWTSQLQSATRAVHYTHGRFVRDNFAELLLRAP